MDKLKGGLADKIPTKSFVRGSLKEGMKVESEHTSDKQVQKEIAKDHLAEDPKYYKKLKKMEKCAFVKGFEKKSSELSMKAKKNETKKEKKIREQAEITSLGC